MHYTAMYGMYFVPLSQAPHPLADGLAASQQIPSVIVAVLCFVITAGFLLSLVPDSRRQSVAAAALAAGPAAEAAAAASFPEPASFAASFPRLTSAPLGGLGQPPRAAPAPRVPVEGAGGTPFIGSADFQSLRADP